MLIVIAIVNTEIINIKTISHNEEKKIPSTAVCDLYNGSNMSPGVESTNRHFLVTIKSGSHERPDMSSKARVSDLRH